MFSRLPYNLHKPHLDGPQNAEIILDDLHFLL